MAFGVFKAIEFRAGVEAEALRDTLGYYSITLRASGYRLVYQVECERLVVMAVGKHERAEAYQLAKEHWLVLELAHQS